MISFYLKFSKSDAKDFNTETLYFLVTVGGKEDFAFE